MTMLWSKRTRRLAATLLAIIMLAGCTEEPRILGVVTQSGEAPTLTTSSTPTMEGDTMLIMRELGANDVLTAGFIIQSSAGFTEAWIDVRGSIQCGDMTIPIDTRFEPNDLSATSFAGPGDGVFPDVVALCAQKTLGNLSMDAFARNEHGAAGAILFLQWTQEGQPNTRWPGGGFGVPGSGGGATPDGDHGRELGAFTRATDLRDASADLSQKRKCKATTQHEASSPDRQNVQIDGRGRAISSTNDIRRMGFSPQCLVFFVDFDAATHPAVFYNLELPKGPLSNADPAMGISPGHTSVIEAFDQIYFSKDEGTALLIIPDGTQDIVMAHNFANGLRQSVSVPSRSFSSAALDLRDGKLVVVVTLSDGNNPTIRLE